MAFNWNSPTTLVKSSDTPLKIFVIQIPEHKLPPPKKRINVLKRILILFNSHKTLRTTLSLIAEFLTSWFSALQVIRFPSLTIWGRKVRVLFVTLPSPPWPTCEKEMHLIIKVCLIWLKVKGVSRLLLFFEKAGLHENNFWMLPLWRMIGVAFAPRPPTTWRGLPAVIHKSNKWGGNPFHPQTSLDRRIKPSLSMDELEGKKEIKQIRIGQKI